MFDWVLNTPVMVDANNNFATPYQNTKVVLCTTTITSGAVSDIFWGKILVVIVPVHYQTSYLKILSMFLVMKQMLVPLTHNHGCLPRRQIAAVQVISKLEL